MTTIITKHGVGVPSSLQVGELAIDKSEPALYTNTGVMVEKIAGASSSGGGGGGGGGVPNYLSSFFYGTNPGDKFNTTFNGSTRSDFVNQYAVESRNFIHKYFFRDRVQFLKGDNEFVIQPGTGYGNVMGYALTHCPLAGTQTRFRVYVNGNLAVDRPEWRCHFNQTDAEISGDASRISTCSELKIVITMGSDYLVNNYEVGYFGVGFS